MVEVYGEDVTKSDEHKELYLMLGKSTSTYTADDKMSAVMLYVTTGSIKKVSDSMSIPYMTVTEWKRSKWWPLALSICHKKKDRELERKFSKVIHDSISEIADRVVNGDWILDKSGEKIRLPLKARDLAFTMGSLYDRRAAIRGESATLVTSGSTSDKLKVLETKFNQFAAQLKAKEIEGVEVEIIREGKSSG